MGASQGLCNQTGSEHRAARWHHGAKPQTQTHPGPPHLPLGDTYQRKKTTIWPRRQSHRAAFLHSYSHRVLERKRSRFPSKSTIPDLPHSIEDIAKYSKITRLKITSFVAIEALCGHVFLLNFKIGFQTPVSPKTE